MIAKIWGIRHTPSGKWQNGHHEFGPFNLTYTYNGKDVAERNIKAYLAWLNHEKTQANPKWKECLQTWKEAEPVEINLEEVK